jgi:hypothetical protein
VDPKEPDDLRKVIAQLRGLRREVADELLLEIGVQ